MAETSGPFDAADLTEADWELMLDQIVDGHLSGLAASVSGSTVRGVDFAAGTYLVRGHWYRNTATLTKASTANAASSARIDRAVFRLDRTANTVTLEVIAGTPGSTTPPALTSTATVTERPFKRWTVGPSASAVANIVDETQALRRGSRRCTSTNRPIDPVAGDLAYETDTGRWIGYGTDWSALVDDTGWVSLSLNGTNRTQWSGLSGRVRKINGVVHLRMSLERGSALLESSSSSIPVNLSAAFRPTAEEYGAGFHSRSPLALRIQTDGDVQIFPLVTDIPAGRTVIGSATWLAG